MVVGRMKSIRFVFSVTLVLLFVSPPAFAQSFQQDITLTGAGSTPYSGVYVGPYTASVPGLPSLDVFCVDFLNRVKIGDTWTAKFTSLSSFLTESENTRFGQLFGSGAVNQTFAKYQQAAYLSTKFAGLDPGPGNVRYGSLHQAMWNIFTPDDPNWTYPDGYKMPAQWIAEAQGADLSQLDLEYWYVITDVNTVDGVGGKQE
jgi:hypothetical protein